MTGSKAVAERPQASVPDLVRTPALQIDSDDIVLPRIYVGQFMSAAVQEQLVKMGDVYTATSGDDPDPQVHFSIGDTGPDAGLLFYVLGLRKAKSYSEAGGELELYDFDDPNAPADAWVTYNYTTFCPTVDADVPCKLLLTRTGRPTALQINTVLKKNSITGPAWINAFRLTTIARENKKGKYAVARVVQVAANPDHVDAAAVLATQMASAPAAFESTGEQPAI